MNRSIIFYLLCHIVSTFLSKCLILGHYRTKLQALTLSLIRQFCSRRSTLNVFCQNIENLHNWMDNLSMTKSGKHCGKRRNCTFCAISSFVTMFSEASESVYMRERVKVIYMYKILITLFHVQTHIDTFCSRHFLIFWWAISPFVYSRIYGCIL